MGRSGCDIGPVDLTTEEGESTPVERTSVEAARGIQAQGNSFSQPVAAKDQK